MPRGLAVALTSLALLWAVALVAVPFLLSREAGAATPFAALVYRGASRVCHQRAERSFRIAGVQQPVCARCTGLYVAGAAGALAGWFFAARAVDARRGRTLLAAVAVPTALTFALEALGVAHPSNAVRAIAALPLGAVAGWMFVVALRSEHDAL